MRIKCIERLLIATRSVEDARRKWAYAGFAVSGQGVLVEGIRYARLAAGAIEIDLCAVEDSHSNPLAEAVSAATSRGGGIVGWTWGLEATTGQPGTVVELPSLEGCVTSHHVSPSLPGVFTAGVEVSSEPDARLELYRREFGINPNTVQFLEHIVVMAPVLEDAIAMQEGLGIPCKRIREAGGGMRQAFFKLERTVIEVVGPARERAGCWGLAFMCGDLAKAIATARENGLQATEPKSAVQGGLIARIVDPLDGVAVALMQAP